MEASHDNLNGKAEWDSTWYNFSHIHAFQACSFNHCIISTPGTARKYKELQNRQVFFIFQQKYNLSNISAKISSYEFFVQIWIVIC